jgi:hypothetical protein
LHFDYERININGGIIPYVEQALAANVQDVPVIKRIYIMYHMAKQEIHNPHFFTKMEDGLIKTQGGS